MSMGNRNMQRGNCSLVGVFLYLALVLAAFANPPWANASITGNPDKLLPAEDLFKRAVVPALKIEIPREGMTSLRRNNGRSYVAGTVTEGAIMYTNVALHLKGGPGSFRPLNDKPALTLNFGHFAEGQKFHGLKKIHLNNSVQDQSYLSEKISRELFEAAGVPAPRAGNATVQLNGRDLGMYVLVEGIDKQFLRRYFKNTSGNVYDGHSGSDVTG